MQKQINFMFLVLLLLFPNLLLSQSEKEIVLETVQQFFNALESRDTTLAKSVLVVDGQFFSIRENDSNSIVKKTTHSNFIKKLPNSNESIREIMDEPVVLIHKQVVVVWTKYKFYKNDLYSHSGVDVFSLIKTSEGWKIAGLIYNIE